MFNDVPASICCALMGIFFQPASQSGSGISFHPKPFFFRARGFEACDVQDSFGINGITMGFGLYFCGKF